MVKITRPADRDCNPAVQTPGMRREAGISAALSGAKAFWMGTGENEPGHASGVHHHGEAESGIYVLEGNIRFRWGDRLEHMAETAPGDFIYVPPFEVHVEENMNPDRPARFLLARNHAEGIVVNVPDPRVGG
jgi:uncharacterized RmlC-like cupin family protein